LGQREGVAQAAADSRTSNGVGSTRSASPVQRAVSQMSEDIVDASVLNSVKENAVEVGFKGTSFVLSAGYLTWALRGATMLASLVASMPAWRSFDPLPILAQKNRVAEKAEEEEKEEEEEDWHEARLKRFLNPMDSGEPDERG
jgi:hypothetical protein